MPARWLHHALECARVQRVQRAGTAMHRRRLCGVGKNHHSQSHTQQTRDEGTFVCAQLGEMVGFRNHFVVVISEFF